MKKRYIFLGLIFMLVLSACQTTVEENTDIPEQTNNGNIEDLEISENFNWRLTKDVKLQITSDHDLVAEVNSSDGSVVYHKAHINSEETYDANISVPSSVEELIINGERVQLNSNEIAVHISDVNNLKFLKASTVYSLYFDGSNDFVFINDGDLNGEIPAATSWSNTDFTISAWIYLQSTSDRKPIASKQGNSVSGNARGFMFSATNGGLELEVFTSDGGAPSDKTSVTSSSGQMSTNTWYHVAATYEYVSDGTSKINLFIDGVNVASSNTAVGPIQTNPQPLHVGRYYWSSGYSRYFHGYMDDFRIYSVARSESEIAGDRSTTVPSNSPNLELNWLFEEGSGTTAGDETSNNNDGTISGAVYSSTTVPYIFTDTDGDGVTDDDDDYPNDPTKAFNNYFPAAGFGSLAYEDLWPGKGDYDFNDVVIDYQFNTITNASNVVVEIIASFKAKASGATLENGFGFNLPDASTAFTGSPEKLNVTGYDLQEGFITLNAYGHEDNQTKPTIIVFDNIFNLLEKTGGGIGVNTEPAQAFVDYEDIIITMVPNGTFTMADFSLTTWNPFIIVDKTRGHEVHLPDYAPTDLADHSLFGQWEDDSNPSVDRYYKTETNLPWALDIPIAFEWPIEKNEITLVYLHFAEWAESGGVLYTDWYSNTAPSYRDDAKIYMVPLP